MEVQCSVLKVLSKLIDKEIFDVGEGVYQYNIVGVLEIFHPIYHAIILTSQIQILLEYCSPPNVLEVFGFWFQVLDPKTVQAKVQSPKMTKKYFPILQKIISRD